MQKYSLKASRAAWSLATSIRDASSPDKFIKNSNSLFVTANFSLTFASEMANNVKLPDDFALPHRSENSDKDGGKKFFISRCFEVKRAADEDEGKVARKIIAFLILLLPPARLLRPQNTRLHARMFLFSGVARLYATLQTNVVHAEEAVKREGEYFKDFSSCHRSLSWNDWIAILMWRNDKTREILSNGLRIAKFLFSKRATAMESISGIIDFGGSSDGKLSTERKVINFNPKPERGAERRLSIFFASKSVSEMGGGGGEIQLFCCDGF